MSHQGRPRFFGSGKIGQPEYYDRSPTQIQYQGLQNPAAGVQAKTDIFDYTVPAGRKAFIEMLDASIVNQSTTGLTSVVELEIQYRASGAGSSTNIAERREGPGMVGQGVPITLSSFMMSTGDRLHPAGTAAVANTGADVIIMAAMKLVEFDA